MLKIQADMKKIYILLLTCGSLMISCEGDLSLKPVSSSTTVTFYTTTNDFLQSINAAYNPLSSYPDRQLNLSETRSDNLYAVSEGGAWTWEGINGFHKSIVDNEYVTDAWNNNFDGVFKANILLEQLAENGEVIADADLRTRLEAEAKFLRAFYYFDLVRWFGKIPVADRPLTAPEALSTPRSSVTEVYDLIISDLIFAKDNLPEVYTSPEDRGRATKYAAEGILAKVYMTRSGPDYGIEGPGLGLDEWHLALPLLNDIIESGQYDFLPSYSSIFSYSNENNAEVIFDVQFMSGGNPIVGSGFPSLLVPSLYFRSLGQVDFSGTAIRPVSNDLLDSYEDGDIRKDFTINSDGYSFNGVPEDRSFFIKYLDITQAPTRGGDWPVNFIALRYTDVLMLKAECILQGAPGSQADVDEIVSQIRGRAGLGPVQNITLPELMEERRKEFAAEGLRWHDLVRSGAIESAIPAWIAKEDVLQQIRPFQKEYILYPVPQAEMDVKVGLYDQNPGY